MNLKMLTIREAGKRMGVSEWTMRKLVREDPDFPKVKVVNRWMVNEDALARYLNAKTDEATS